MIFLFGVFYTIIIMYYYFMVNNDINSAILFGVSLIVITLLISVSYYLIDKKITN